MDEKGVRDTVTNVSTPASNSATGNVNPDISASQQQNKPTTSPKDHHIHFQNVVGISSKAQPDNFYKRVNNAYYWHLFQYWFTASLINFLLLAQIIIGALVTGFGASDKASLRRAIVWLGGTNTVIAAVLAYFKSRNQPNRARQFSSSLGAVRDAIADTEADFAGLADAGHANDGARGPNDKGFHASAHHYDVERRIAILRKMYYDARKDAEANYPDLWVKYGEAVDKAASMIGNKSKNTMLPTSGNQSMKNAGRALDVLEELERDDDDDQDGIKQAPTRRHTTGEDLGIVQPRRTNTVSSEVR